MEDPRAQRLEDAVTDLKVDMASLSTQVALGFQALNEFDAFSVPVTGGRPRLGESLLSLLLRVDNRLMPVRSKAQAAYLGAHHPEVLRANGRPRAPRRLPRACPSTPRSSRLTWPRWV